MSDNYQPQRSAHLAPFLLSPVEEAVLDGNRVTFRWDSVDGATGYRLEVALNSSFISIVHVEILGPKCERTVENQFNTDCATHFWRIFALFPDGESHGEVVESFISAPREEAERHHMRPDRVEKMGPVPELITGGAEDPLYLRSRNVGTQEVVLETPDLEVSKFYETEEQTGVEHENLEFRQIWTMMYIVIAVVLGITAILFFWMRIETQRVVELRAAEAIYPEIRNLEAETATKLRTYDVIDADGDRYQIPIERAMELMLAETYAQVTQ